MGGGGGRRGRGGRVRRQPRGRVARGRERGGRGTRRGGGRARRGRLRGGGGGTCTCRRGRRAPGFTRKGGRCVGWRRIVAADRVTGGQGPRSQPTFGSQRTPSWTRWSCPQGPLRSRRRISAC
eukprot:jgi/Mesvir1/6124/Mv26559-RA.1